MVEVTVLGNCARQTANYDTVNFVVEKENTVFLIDAGPGVVQQLYSAGYNPLDVDIVVITHQHADHSSGYSYLLFSIFGELLEEDRDHSIELVATEEVKEGLEQFVEFSAPFIGEDSLTVNFNEVENFREDFRFGETGFSVFPTEHAVPSFGLDFGNTVITGDTAPTDSIPECEVLFHESTTTDDKKELMNEIGHSVARDAGRKASELGAEELYLMHPNPEHREKENELEKEAREEFEGHVEVPEELWSKTW